LREAVAQKTGLAELPEATRLDPEEFFHPGYDARRVRVQAVLQSLSADGRTLELQSGLQRFLARLSGAGQHRTARVAPPGEQANALGIPVGSRLELTGVYAGRGGNPATGGEIGSFELLVDSPADIHVLARPPFWTLPRLLILVGALAAVLMLALIWIRLLHHKVQTRTVQLQVEVREREHAEQQRALATERSRIARDLHDDLGSSLTEITLLAIAGPGQEVTPQEASERLESIAGKSRTIVHALDEIVWAADPERDTLSSLARYLASYAEEYLAGLKVACRVQIPNAFPERLVSGEVRHELFLAVKEALTNAVRHGHATEVGFRLRLAGDRMEISVRDNGAGFDLASHPTGYGLSNLRTRLENMGGRCEIQSSPGGGTTVSLVLPLNPPHPKR
jgi:signal transduction histidine kinase